MKPSWLRELQPLSLRVAVLSLSLALVFLAFRAIWFNHPHYDNPTALFVAFIMLVAAFLLIHLSRWGRKVVVAILWFPIIVVPIGVINPFFASDLSAEGGTPPLVEYLLALIAPFVAWGIWCLHILGKHKEKFR